MSTAKEYKLVGEKNPQGLRRIKALRDIPDVCAAGDFGGWIKKEANLSHDDNAWVSRDAWVYGNAWVSGNAQVSGDAWEISPLQIQGSKHFLTTSSHTTISIGCEKYFVQEWLQRYEEIGKKNSYTDEQIQEYLLLIQTAAAWLQQKFGTTEQETS